MIRTRARMQLCVTWLVLNLGFIWGNSLLPGEASAAFSDFVGKILTAVLPKIFGAAPVQGSGLLRKLAHFGEFALLGACLRWLFGMLSQRPARFLLLPVAAGIGAALVDEGIQMVVPGRGPGIMDVGIDTLGVILGVAVLSTIHYAIKLKNMEETKQ